MIYLISIVLLSATLIILMVVFRGKRLNFWMNFVNSELVEKSDLFFKKLFKLLKKIIKNNFIITKRIIEITSLKIVKFLTKVKKALNLFFKKLIKKLNKRMGKLSTQKMEKPVSNYLKDIEEYKNGKEKEKKIEF